MNAKRQAGPRSEPTVFPAVWAGALIGLCVPLAATLVHLELSAGDRTVTSAWLAHTSHPRLWLIDLAPLLIATLAGLYARARLRRAGLEASERQLGFDVLMRMGQQAVVVADERDHIVEWSSGAEELLGHTAGDVVGKPLSCLIATPDVRPFEAEIARTRRDSGPGGRFVLPGR